MIKPMAHQAISLKKMKGQKAFFDMSDPGTGKTMVQILDFAERRKKRGGCALVFGTKSILTAAWQNDFKKFAPHLKTVVATAKNRKQAMSSEADAYIVNHDGVKDLLKYPTSFWKKFDTLIIDECFPAGTLVDTPTGSMPIEMLKVGDLVHTSSGPLPISNTFIKSSDTLCQIEFENGDKIECTENHPFATTAGWVEARATRGLSVVRLDLCKLNQSRPTLLQSFLQQTCDVVKQVFARTQNYCRKMCCEIARTILMEQRCALQTGNESETQRCSQSIWTQAKATRGEWPNFSMRKNDARNASNVLGISTRYRNGLRKIQRLSDALQTRLRATVQKMGHRSGRKFTHIAQTLGCEERFILGTERVVRVSRVECASPRLVYNLQVNGPHTYSVSGVLVHNCTAFKHHTSQRSKAMAKLAKNFDYRRCMSGTPTSNGICDIWHQMYILDGGKRLGSSFFGFRSACCTPVQTGPSAQHLKWVDKEGIEDAIVSLISDISVRHRFEDCVDIPENHKYAVTTQLSAKHQETYDELEKQSLAIIGKTTVTAINGAVLATKLLQAASGAVYNDDGGYSPIATGRYELVLDLVEEREHSIVFYQWEHQLHELVKEATSRKLSHVVWNPDKPQIEKEFQAGKYQVLFAHPQSAGHGLTLTKGTATIWASPTYNLEHFLQGLKRVHRIGQTEKTETIVIIAEGTIDERVWEALQAKKVKMDALFTALKEAA